MIEEKGTSHKLDELFRSAKEFAKSKRYMEMMDFYRRMKHLGPYNAALANIQRPGAFYLQTERYWNETYKRNIKDTASPVIILMPFGPIEFLYDLSDTYVDSEIWNSDQDVSEYIKRQFELRNEFTGNALSLLESNLNIHGIDFVKRNFGSAQAAQIRMADKSHSIKVEFKKRTLKMKATFLIEVNKELQDGGVFHSMCHELGHLLCHHLRVPGFSTWKVRRLTPAEEEFEAESVAHIVCCYIGYQSSSAEYLSDYCKSYDSIPAGVSPDYIFNAATVILQMITRKMKATDGLLYKHNQEFRKVIDKVKSDESGRKKNKATGISDYPRLMGF